MAGVVTDSGVFVELGGEWRLLPPTPTPLGVAIATFLATNPEPCPVCGRFDCDLDEWHDLMHCDVAGDLDELRPGELPY